MAARRRKPRASFRQRPPAKWLQTPELPILHAGVDEAGRGALAGDVVAAAVILAPASSIEGLDDSKKLTPARRESLYEAIIEQCACFAIGRAGPGEIDRLNILRASLLAMRRAVEQLEIEPESVLVDGNILPDWAYPAKAIPGGDGKIQAIAAASTVSAARSSGSRLSTWLLPQARARVWSSRVIVVR